MQEFHIPSQPNSRIAHHICDFATIRKAKLQEPSTATRCAKTDSLRYNPHTRNEAEATDPPMVRCRVLFVFSAGANAIPFVTSLKPRRPSSMAVVPRLDATADFAL
jgi:hypothetical protein